MVTCPVCEHAQASGDACEVCGRELAPDGGEAVAVAPIEGLDPTRYADVAFAAALIPDLEPTRAAPVEVAAEPPADWVERTPLAAAGPAAPDEAVAGLEPTLHDPPPAEAPRDPFAPETCRYCRTEVPPGDVFCPRCGMKLEVYRPAALPRRDA